MSRRIRICFLALLTVLAIPAAAGAARHPALLRCAWRFALRGHAAGLGRPETQHGQGYADQLFQIERRRIKNLQLIKLGCGAESASSMISGHGNDKNARRG